MLVVKTLSFTVYHISDFRSPKNVFRFSVLRAFQLYIDAAFGLRWIAGEEK